MLTPPPPPPVRALPAVRHAVFLRSQNGIDRMFERMPYMSSWAEQIKKLRKDEGALGWDELLNANDGVTYVKGRAEHQGTSE